MKPLPTTLRAALAAAIAAAVLSPPASAAIFPGDIIVADPNASEGSGALIRVDPATGQHSLISDNVISSTELFEDPYGVDLDAQGNLLVADASALGGGGVIRVDPNTGQQSAVSSNSTSAQDLFLDPRALAVSTSGAIYVVDRQAFGGNGGVISVDPTTGQQAQVASNLSSKLDLFDDPSAIAIETSGDLAIADPNSPPGDADESGAVIGVDLDTTEQNLISNNALSGLDLFDEPLGLSAEPNGNLVVANGGTNPGVVRVSRFSGQQGVLAAGGYFSAPTGIAVDAAGFADVADPEAFGGGGGVIRVNPVSGEQTVITGLGPFEDPSGLMVVPPVCQGRYATVVGTDDTDSLVGTPGNDVIVTQGGDDIADGRGGADLICGGAGRNRLVGKDGKDSIVGGGGADVILSGDGADAVNGEGGADKIDGGSGKDVLAGSLGHDNLVGGRGNDKLLGQPLGDRLTGGKGNDLLKGGSGADKLTGGAGRDRLRGGPGRDRQKQ